jgi:hypothetical protein
MTRVQGDQIGRIFTDWAFFSLGSLKKIILLARFLWQLPSTENCSALILTENEF